MIVKKIKKYTDMKNSVWNILAWSSKIVAVLLLLNSCTQEPILWKIDSNNQVITQYVEANEEFSEFNGLLESTQLNSLLSVRGPFTLFLPGNEQMEAFYADKGISSYLDLSEELQKALVLNHVIVAQIETGDIGLGALREVNGIGDYIVSEFEGSDIIINKDSKIIKRDIRTSNGVVHHISKVLDPVTKSVYEVLADNPDYLLFTEGLELTGIRDTLQTITFPYGNKIARTRFTILAVSDATFNSYGINTIEELIAQYTTSTDSLTYIDNPFYRFIEYHCLSETYYLSDLETALYPILSYDNNLLITVDDDYKINLVEDEYTGFVIETSNMPGKNGTVHTVNDMLPVYFPPTTKIEWETTDHFDLKQGDYYLKEYARFFDGENDFANIKWGGDYLLYYLKINAPTQWNQDCLAMSGWWWCEVTTPKIMKGKYTLTSHLWQNQTEYAVYVDGVNTALIKRTDPTITTPWGEFDWTTTTTHKVKVVATSPGLLFWDRLIFTPIR